MGGIRPEYDPRASEGSAPLGRLLNRGRPRTSSLSRAGASAAVVVFALGVLVVVLVAGLWLLASSGEAVASEGAGALAKPRGPPGALEEQFALLRGEVAEMQRRLDALELVERPRSPAPVDGVALGESRREVESSRRPAGSDLEQRLAEMERLLEQYSGAVGRAALSEPLEVPPGEPNRFLVGQLWDRVHGREGDGVDGVVRQHRLWSYQRILDAYGQPDEVNDQGDYIEWVYELPTRDDNFDFHFVDGFCVLAH